jgi:hypothetical protein
MEWKVETTKFIELHYFNGDPVTINSAAIVYFCPDPSSLKGCWILLIGSTETINVAESYDQIKDAIASLAGMDHLCQCNIRDIRWHDDSSD